MSGDRLRYIQFRVIYSIITQRMAWSVRKKNHISVVENKRMIRIEAMIFHVLSESVRIKTMDAEPRGKVSFHVNFQKVVDLFSLTTWLGLTRLASGLLL